ncbi:MAG: ion transporter [Alteromonadaceae bacterium]|nr:ion transporter [Alteromonadaceae bacterium]
MMKCKVFELLESGFEGSIYNKLLSGFIVTLIITNVIAVIAESYAPLGQRYHLEFRIFNLISVTIFTLEYLARIWVCTEAPDAEDSKPLKVRIRYIFSSVALIDLMAIAPFYLSFIFAIDLRYLRMLRMLRLLKLTHYFKGLRLFINVLKQELPTIGAAIFIMIVLITLSGGIMYSIEHTAQPEVFDSIPSAIWWSVVTMTTVGYGDVTPITFLSKFIAVFIMLLGVGVVALPAAMLAAKFGEELISRKKHLEVEVAHALQDGIVTTSERAALDKLAEELNISQENLEKLLNSRALTNYSPITCPHCQMICFNQTGHFNKGI